MTFLHRGMAGAECVGELLHHADGTMLSTGATQRNGQVAAVGFGVLGNPVRQEGEDILVHFREGSLAIQEFGNGGIQSVEAAEFCIPVRIRQASQVENEIRVCGNSVFEAKRLQKYGEFA